MSSSVVTNQLPSQHGPRKTSLRQVATWGLPLAAALAVLAHFSPLAAGAVYLLLFVSIALWQPRIALMIAFALVPIVQVLPLHLPVHLDVSDFSMAVLFPICMLKTAQMGKPVRMGPSLWPTLIYLLFCALSTIPHLSTTGLSAYGQMLVYLIFAVMICASFPGGPEDLLFAFKGAVGMLAVFAFLYLVTHNHAPNENKNLWGAVLGSGFAICLELWFAAVLSNRRKEAKWLIIALVLIGVALLLSVSRGGWMEATIGSLVILAFRRRYRLIFRVALVLAPIIIILWLALPRQQQKYATAIGTNNVDVQARLKIIQFSWNMFKAHPFAGVGVQLRKEIDQTDIFTITLAETGVQGLLAFLAIHVVVFWTAWKLRRRVAQTDPRFSLIVLGAALILCRFVHGMVDIYWARGPQLWAWGAVGMLAAVYFETGRGTNRPLPPSDRKRL